MEVIELIITGWTIIFGYAELGLTLATSWEGWRDMLIPLLPVVGLPILCVCSVIMGLLE